MPAPAASTWSWPRRSTAYPATRRTLRRSISTSPSRARQLITVAEGPINELHVGLKGTMNALFLKDLGQKVRRGLEGRVREGRAGGGSASATTSFASSTGLWRPQDQRDRGRDRPAHLDGICGGGGPPRGGPPPPCPAPPPAPPPALPPRPHPRRPAGPPPGPLSLRINASGASAHSISARPR